MNDAVAPLANQILPKYSGIRKKTEDICRPLKTEDCVVQPITDVSPPKWHLGHTSWFFENFILNEHLPGYKNFNTHFNYFFNSYYESQGPRVQRSSRGNMTRPTMEEIMDYRHYVDEQMQRLLSLFPGNEGPAGGLKFLIETGLQHEQQHQELLVTDLKYILGSNPLFPAYKEDFLLPSSNGQPSSSGFQKVEEGLYKIGFEGKGFCWDNERNPHKVYLQTFEIADRLVTNEEYLEFIEDGGYENFQHWLSEGWDWMKQFEVKAPLYWFFQDGEWLQYTLRGLEKVSLKEPVTHISYYEADAFARWKGMRLPTEFEWEAACKQFHQDIPESGNFLEENNFHPIPQISFEDDQLLGNVWEWTASAYLPYPGYRPFEGALGEYNGKFMINQMVLRGGSCATPKSHIRITYRNFFHPDKRWQFTGIRLAR